MQMSHHYTIMPESKMWKWMCSTVPILWHSDMSNIKLAVSEAVHYWESERKKLGTGRDFREQVSQLVI